MSFTIFQSPASAVAATITLDNVVATWSNVHGGSSIGFTGNGTNDATVTWGTPHGGTQSGYNFSGISGSLDATPDSSPEFVIGSFTHLNQPIAGGTSISDARLTIGTDVYVDSSFIGNYSFVYDVEHWETTNTARTCADGGVNGTGANVNGCADRVQTNYNSLSDTFQIGSDLYTLDILGFRFFDGTDTLSFWTAESANNRVYLLARAILTSETVDNTDVITDPKVVSDPELTTNQELTTNLVVTTQDVVTTDETPTSLTVLDIETRSVPEPGMSLLLMTGIAVVGMLGRRRASPFSRTR